MLLKCCVFFFVGAGSKSGGTEEGKLCLFRFDSFPFYLIFYYFSYLTSFSFFDLLLSFRKIFSSTHFGTSFTVSDIHISFLFSFILFQFNIICLFLNYLINISLKPLLLLSHLPAGYIMSLNLSKISVSFFMHMLGCIFKAR